jgi:hypothetical protein
LCKRLAALLIILVNLLDLGPRAGRPSMGASVSTIVIICSAPWGSISLLAHLGDDGVADALQLLHLVLKLVSRSMR